MPGELETFVKKVVTRDPVAQSIKRAAKIDVSLGEIVETADYLNQGFIAGLDVQWIGPSPSTTIFVTKGAAFIPGEKQTIAVLEEGSEKVFAPTPGTNHYYVYLFINADGDGEIQVSSVAPGERYSGTARTKSNNENMRYLGSLNQNQASPSWRRFERENDILLYTDTLISTEVLSSGSNQSLTNIDVSAYIPPHVRLLWVNGTAFNSGSVSGNAKAWFSSSLSGANPPSSGQFFMEVNNNTTLGNYTGWIKGAPNLNYAVEDPDIDAWLQVRGYVDTR